MSYLFNPLTDEELDSFDLITQGIYNFEVTKATKKVSKSGNPMAELQLSVWGNEGKAYFVFDYLVFSNVNLNIRKVSHFSKAVGLYEEYKKGQLPEELEGLSGKVEIGIQEEQPKPNGGSYPKKNIVIDYISSDGIAAVNTAVHKPVDNFEDDSIPF